MNCNPSPIQSQAISARIRSLLTRFILWTSAVSASTSTLVGISLILPTDVAQAEQINQSATHQSAAHQSATYLTPANPTNQTAAAEFSGFSDLQSLSDNSALDGRLAERDRAFTPDRIEAAATQSTNWPSENPLRLAQLLGQAVSTDKPSPEKSSLEKPSKQVPKQGSLVLGSPYIRFQGAYVLQGDESSARARLTGLYPVRRNLLFGAEVDLTTGNAFSDSPGTGLRLNELYVAMSPDNMPNLRFVAGLMDLTSYFDRNSFAKDGTTHFFNPVFQTNPALSAAGIASRPGVLVNWSVTDYLDLKATGFSSRRDLGRLTLDSFAGEVGVRFGNAIIRGTYVTSRDSGQRTGFEEIFSFRRPNGRFGFESDDREEAYGINAEVYIPALKMGLFGRYGRYNNLSLGQGGNTYSFGLNLLDLFMAGDRLGIGYGRQLSNEQLRRDLGERNPDVLEVFYDAQILPNLRAGITFQQRNQFSESVFGFRIKTEFDVVPFRRPFQ